MRAIVFNDFYDFFIQNTPTFGGIDDKKHAFMFFSGIKGLKDISVADIIDETYPLWDSVESSLNC